MDLKLGSIPLRIQGSFFLMAAVLGFGEGNPARLAIWIVVVLVSVIFHELGHALMGKAFGLSPRIVLQGMGGLTYFDGARAELSTWRSIAISVAGPFAGFAFGLVIVGLQLAGLHPAHPLAQHALRLLLWVNIAWGVFNLLPMLPLDGGNVLRAVARGITRDHGEKIARVISVLVAVGIVLLSIRLSQWWVLYLGVMYAFQNVQALRQSGQIRTDQTFIDAVERAHAALARGEAKEAAALLQPALSTGASIDLRRVGLRLYVIALLEDARWEDAIAVMETERRQIALEDLDRWSGALRQIGRPADADRVDELRKAPAPLSEFRA